MSAWAQPRPYASVIPLRNIESLSHSMTGSLHPWHARGLVFENCNCQLLCPGHVSFKQPCSNERCVGNWALHVDAGRFDAIDLAGLNAVIVFDAPQRMYEGG